MQQPRSCGSRHLVQRSSRQRAPGLAFSQEARTPEAPSAEQLKVARRMQVPLLLGHQFPSQCHLQTVTLGLIEHIEP